MKRHLGIAGFDYATDKRGHWARLRNGSGYDVIVTDYPTSLLSMLKGGFLAGAAKLDAEKLLTGSSVVDRLPPA